MKVFLIPVLALFFGACSTMQARTPTPSVLVDLDPARADRSVIVESITADRNGMLYLADRVSGNILRVDPKSPKPTVVGRIEAREIEGKKVQPNASRVAFNPPGRSVYRRRSVRRSRAHQGKRAQPGKAGIGANLRHGHSRRQWHRLRPSRKPFHLGRRQRDGLPRRRKWRDRPAGGQIDKDSRTLPDGKAQQAITANGLELIATVCSTSPTHRAVRSGKS
jgi:hypothetical protein